LALVLASLVGGACVRGVEPKLAALKQEVMASLDLPGGRFDHQTEDEAHTALGKPVYAHINRVFAFDDRAAAAAAVQMAIEAAESTGWVMEADEVPGDPVDGAKTLETGAAIIGIALYQQDGIFKVSIRLEHR
jgi:hypothetical protein